MVMTTTSTTSVEMDGIEYPNLRAAIRAWPTSGAVWIDGEPYTYDVDCNVAVVYDEDGQEAYRVTI